VFGLVVVVSLVLAVSDYANRGWLSTAQAFVEAGPSTSITVTGAQVPDYELDGQRIAQDLSQVVQSRGVASYIRASAAMTIYHLSPSDVQSDLSVSTNGRTIDITARAPSAKEANGIVSVAADVLETRRTLYVGSFEAARSHIQIISQPNAVQASIRPVTTSLVLRAAVGLLVAVALALAWDYLDDSVHTPDDLERWLEAPILARV